MNVAELCPEKSGPGRDERRGRLGCRDYDWAEMAFISFFASAMIVSMLSSE